MASADYPLSFPVAAMLDPQYRLPPFRQIIYTPTILVSAILLLLSIIVVIVISRRSRVKGRLDARREAIKGIGKIIYKRGGKPEDADRTLEVLNNHPECDPAMILMLKDRFRDELYPLLEMTFDRAFADRMENIFFPPYKDTRFAAMTPKEDGSVPVPEDRPERKSPMAMLTESAIRDLMDMTLKPGAVARLVFGGLDGTHECLVMGYDTKTIHVTLPSHRDRLVAAIQPGMAVEGTLESGSSLIGFTSSVVQAFAGNMPYCRIMPWKSAWEIRKRASVRLPAVLDVDFQHIATAKAESINMSSLEKEIGTLRPGRLIDISHGGCCIETPSAEDFKQGDMIRFSRTIAPGDPAATFLGAVVSADTIDPERHEGSIRRLHIQFLIIDDVSQRILVRALRQLQSAKDRDEWMHAQQLLQTIRRNNISVVGSPAPKGTAFRSGSGGTSSQRMTARPPTRAIEKPATRVIPKSD